LTTLLNMWTVYTRPREHPDARWMARRWIVGPGHLEPTCDMFTADSLAELRMLLPAGLHCQPRQPNDDPTIVEVWL
jgi:hypothetical protein